MNAFTAVFLLALALSFGIEQWLSRRQVAHVRAHRNAVPEAFRDTITPEAHRKAADYTVDKNRLGDVERVIGVAFLLLFTLGGGIAAIQAFWNGIGLSPLWTGIAIILSTMILMQLLELPLGVYQTFVIEERYGFNRNTPAQFAKDLGLQMLLSIALGVPLLALILWVMDSVGSLWWLLAWAILMSFSILMSWAFPTFIAPLFNKFTPLPDETLRKRIESLLERCGFQSKGIFVMDGSRRSGHGNAYFTGVGSSKRIVFFDTLVDSLGHDELEAVLAHELGHFKRKHVQDAGDQRRHDPGGLCRAGLDQRAGLVLQRPGRAGRPVECRGPAALHAGGAGLHYLFAARHRPFPAALRIRGGRLRRQPYPAGPSHQRPGKALPGERQHPDARPDVFGVPLQPPAGGRPYRQPVRQSVLTARFNEEAGQG